MYVLAQNARGLVLVDMHAAHERITYERLKAGQAGQGIRSQTLLVPVTLNVSEREADLAEAHAEALESVGIQCDRSGPESLLVRKVPTLLQDADVSAQVIGFVIVIFPELLIIFIANTFDSKLAKIDNLCF